MRGLAIVAVVAALSTVAPGVAGAMGPVQLGIGGGFNVPTGETGATFDVGFNVRGLMGFKPPMLPFALRGALGYEKLDLTEGMEMAATSANILSGVAGMKMNLINVGPVKPYVTAGLGAFHVNVDTEDATEGASAVKFGIDGGIGVDMRFGMIGAFVEARMQNVFTDEGWNPALTGSSTLSAVPVTFGVTF